MSDPLALAESSYENGEVQISDVDLRQIYVEMGYPVVQPEDLEIPPEDVKDLVIRGALMEYWAWFPIQTVQEIEVASQFAVPFPNPTTWGVIDARIVPNSGVANVPTLSPFMNERNWSIAAGGLFGQGQYDFEMVEAKLLNRRYIQSSQQLLVAKRVKVDRTNREITGFMNAPGILRIIWADYSLNFDDIDFQKRKDVIKLSKAHLLRTIAMIRSQQDSNTGMNFNADSLNARADKLEEEVMDRWKNFSKVAILRG